MANLSMKDILMHLSDDTELSAFVRMACKIGAREIEELQGVVELADALYVSAATQAQDESRRKYQEEFGHNGPSLAGFLRGGADRNYHYARHKAGECPLPRHKKYMEDPL